MMMAMWRWSANLSQVVSQRIEHIFCIGGEAASQRPRFCSIEERDVLTKQRLHVILSHGSHLLRSGMHEEIGVREHRESRGTTDSQKLVDELMNLVFDLRGSEHSGNHVP